MTQYEKNLRTLSKHYSSFDRLIELGREKLEESLTLKEEIADDGNIVLKIEKDNRVCYLNGKRNTTDAAKIWVKSLGELKQNTTVLMFGTGNPSYLEELVKQTKNRIIIIVYEPSFQIFLKFLEMVDLEYWMEKHSIVFWVGELEGMDYKNLSGIVRQTMKYEMLIYLKHFVLPNYELLFKKESVEFIRMCRDIAVEETVQYNTNMIFSKVIVKNLLVNVKHLCTGYKTTQLLDVISPGMPGILVAAGPSLNRNIKELKRAKGKAFIVAVDTAIKPLLSEGIVPDMFAIIDGMKPLDLFEAEGAQDIPMMTALDAASEVLDYHTGKKFFYNEGYEFAERIFRESGKMSGGVASGGSVATNAFSLLYMLGINTIILVGQDLAYTNNKSHADGTFHEVMEEHDTSRFMMVEGNTEEKVPTTTGFKIFLDWYKNYIAGCKQHKEDRGETFRVINATEGGAKIEGTEIMTLRQAIDDVCTEEFDITERIQSLKPMLDEEKRVWAEKYLTDISEEFHKLALLAGKVKNMYKKLERLCSRKKIDHREYLDILDKLNKNIEEIKAMSVYQLISITMVNASYILRSEQYLSEKTLQKEGQEIARKGILYMENVKSIAEAFEEYAEEIFGKKECAG